MEHCKIFVAGAKDLAKQRNLIKAWANDYNEESNSPRIVIRSYENFENNQSVYNQYIENSADIVLFVIEGRIGEKTEDELKLASSCLNKNGKPKVFVFLKRFVEKTEEIKHVEDVVNQYVKEYYIEYENDEDLISKTEKHIQKYLKKRKPPVTVKQICLIAMAIVGILVACVFFFFSLGLGVSYLAFDKSESEIIDENIIALDDYSALLFKYEDMMCYYYLQNDSLGTVSYDGSRETRKQEVSKVSVFMALSFSNSTLVLQKYTKIIAQRLSGGSRAQQITAVCLIVGLYVGTFIGFSQGYSFGEQLQEDELHENVEKQIKNPQTWEYKILRVKEAQMLMQ